MADKKLLQQAEEAIEDSIRERVNDAKFKDEREHLIERVSNGLIDSFKPFLENIEAKIQNAIKEIKVDATVEAINIPEVKIPPISINIPELKDPIVNIPPIIIPEIKIPIINVPKIEIPEIKLPTINVPQPRVTVTIPPIKVPDVIMPDEMTVRGWVGLMGVDLNNPLPVQLRDSKGQPVSFGEITQIASGGGGGGGRRGLQETKELPVPDFKYAPLNSDSAVLENARLIKAESGVLYGIAGYNNSGAALYIQIHNTTTQPAEGAVPIITMRAAATNNFSWDAGRFGKAFTTGMFLVTSTTVDTKTLNSSADCWFNILYM